MESLVSILFEGEAGVLKDCLVKPGILVSKNQLLAEIIDPHSSTIHKVLANSTGRIKSVFISIDKKITYNEPLFEIEVCHHRILMGKLCAECGEEIDRSDVVFAGFLSANQSVKLVKDYAAEKEIEKIQTLLKNKKLVLILDVDNTLVHCSTFPPSVTQDATILIDIHNRHPHKEKMLSAIYGITENSTNVSTSDLEDSICETLKSLPKISAQEQKQYVDQLEGAVHLINVSIGAYGEQVSHFLKLRPGVITFLRELQHFYDIYFYTQGTDSYVTSVLQVLDPLNIFIQKEKVFSRKHTIERGNKSLSTLFPCDTRLILILDDRCDVWSSVRNLIQISDYSYLPYIDKDGNYYIPGKEIYQHTPTSSPVAKKTKTEEQETSEVEQGNEEVEEEKDADLLENESLHDSVEAVEEPREEEAKGNEEEPRVDMSPNEVVRARKRQRRTSTVLDEEEEMTFTSNYISSVVDSVEKEDLSERDVNDIEFILQKLDRCVAIRNKEIDEQLDACSNLLRLCHVIFFIKYQNIRDSYVGEDVTPTNQIPNAADVLAYFRNRILHNVVISTTGILDKRQYTSFRTYPIGVMALDNGAIIQDELNEATTHLIVGVKNTEKSVIAAQQYPNVKMVTPDWLRRSVFTFKKGLEERFDPAEESDDDLERMRLTISSFYPICDMTFWKKSPIEGDNIMISFDDYPVSSFQDIAKCIPPLLNVKEVELSFDDWDFE